ncbi:M23 family metallopeptidase [Moheibacter sediminis]|uniref:Peptidase family M23 n=1 Tax=Moheibacter sediminis TaxID=1434700 RepID=A0A1W1ZQI3_9FLAO|nr:M23 family metallopeptidase [Moheibacter sediminis]SMC50654.1 Peptidase family M23 [Moheibacter sediminis]
MKNLALLIVLSMNLYACAQSAENKDSNNQQKKEYPKSDFRNPMGITNYLAGNFGELRNNHFHSGIDIKTNQKEGYNIYAVGDGYVSRINISPRGYGNAIYIDHVNGYTSVYGHLQKFNDVIEKYTREYQYKNEEFTVEIYPKKDELIVKSGDIIALSGNSGGSAGPHLHFEIRDTKTEEPINPFLFGFDVPDTSAPLINGLYIYPIHGNVNGKTTRQAVTAGTTVSASGKVGLGIKAYDKHNGADNLNGIYQINIFVNEEPHFTYTNERLNFSTTRAINCLVDYEDRMKNNSWVYQLFLSEGNPLHMFSNVKNNGIIDLEEGKEYAIRIEVLDYAGNKKEAKYKLAGKTPPADAPKMEGENVFRWNKENYFKKDGIEIVMPKGTIYEDLNFTHKKTDKGKHYVHDWNVPVHTYYTVSIEPEGIPTAQLDKAILLREYQQRGAWKTEYITAEYKNGKVIGEARDFGVFSVIIDDTKPVINPVNIKENSTFTASKSVVRFTISDSQSGIKGFAAYVDGKWILTNYDQKSKSLTIDLQKEGIADGKHQLELKVWDEKNNTATYTANFSKGA